MGRNKGIRVFTIVVIAILTLFIASVSFAQRSALVFLTDFGLKEGAVCAMKGIAFGVDPDLKMYDVTHEISSFNIWEGAYILKQAASFWPSGTVFVGVVDPDVGTERKPIVLKTKTGHYFVGPDNGLFSLVAEDMGIEEVRVIDIEKNRFPGSEKSYSFDHRRDVFSYVGARIASGQLEFEDVGPVLQGDIVRIEYRKPTLVGNSVSGNIPVIDIYGIVWTNIPWKLLKQLNPEDGDLFRIDIYQGDQLIYTEEMIINMPDDVPEDDVVIFYMENLADLVYTYGISSGPEWTIVYTQKTPKVSGKVTQIDKYGNVHTDILESIVQQRGFEIGDIVQIKIGDKVFEAPFVTVYGDVDRGKPLIRLTDGHVQLAINYGNFASTYGLKVGDLVLIKLKEKDTYKSELEIRHLVRTNNRADYDSDEVFANFREVRLGSIGQGKLYRSSHPSMNDPRAPYASKLMENVGIKTVINLSDSQDELLKNLQYSNYYKSIYDKGNLIALNMGVDPMSDDFAQKLETGLLFMISKEPPYLLHCVEGKDRAGIVTALLGAIMDASTEEIYADYVKSYENYYKVQYGTAAYDAVEEIISDLFVEMNDGEPVDDSNVKQVAIKYLTEKVGLTVQQVSQLQEKLK